MFITFVVIADVVGHAGNRAGYEQMPRHKLRDTSLTKICKAGKPGIFSDVDGLYLRIQPSGSRSWVFIWKRHGARREIGLDAHPVVSLVAARAKAEKARTIAASGGDPEALMVERQVAPAGFHVPLQTW